MEIVTKLNALQGDINTSNVIDVLIDIDESITVKRFPDNDSLLLVHTDFNDNNNNSTLYNECRSFVVAVKDNVAKIVSYSHETIVNDKPNTTNIVFEESFEGTMVSLFFYDDKWHYHTTRCTDVDASYFYNSNITFGKMFDDCLSKVNMNRDTFTQHLNRDHMYSFVIVHYENKSIINYSDRFGDNYAQLVLVVERDSELINVPFTSSDYYIVPRVLESAENSDCTICKVYDETRRTYKYYKVYSEQYALQKKRNPNFSNVWYSYIQIFLNNDKEYGVDAYRKDHNITTQYVVAGNPLNITGMIHLLYKETATIMLELVTHFTTFENERYIKINGDDYDLMDNSVYNNVKKQIAVLQNLVNCGIITNTNGIVTHMRKHVSVYEFIHVIKGILALQQFDFFTINNTYYINYSDFLMNEIRNK